MKTELWSYPVPVRPFLSLGKKSPVKVQWYIKGNVEKQWFTDERTNILSDVGVRWIMVNKRRREFETASFCDITFKCDHTTVLHKILASSRQGFDSSDVSKQRYC